MKTRPLHFFAGLVLAVFFMVPAAPQARGQSTDWSIAQLDRILAAAPPGQQLAPAGDMQILVSNLKVWRDQLAGTPGQQSLFSGTVPLWTGGKVYYTFSNNVTVLHQKAFLDGANEWAIFANLQFIPRTNQANYVTIFEDASLEGGQSAVGMVGGQQFLSIGPAAWNRPTVCHEVGHTLGLLHEQQRPDRTNYVVILTNNIVPGQEANFVIVPNSLTNSPYDFLSVMEYARNALSIGTNLDTIEPLPAYSQYLNILGQNPNAVLSPFDRAGMVAKYGAATNFGPVVVNTKDSGPGSLRAALYFGLDHPGTNLSFAIPNTDHGLSNGVFNIQPTDQLPSLAYATILDGSTETTNSNPNGPSILINGALAQPPSVFPHGLRFGGTNCSVRALIINGFAAYGVVMDGTNVTGNNIRGCYLGVDAAGATAVPSGYSPIGIINGASGNTVGGTNAAARNIISGSAFQGLVIRDPGTHNNIVQGNYIGLNAAGTAALPNSEAGIQIFNGAQSNTIGGTLVSQRNVISGNTLQGVAVSDTNTLGNVIAGNYIGLNPGGTNAVPNGYAGVDMFGGSQGTTVGGSVPGSGNVISGNLGQGVVTSNPGSGNNVVQGNWIGLNAPGTAAVGNGAAGVGMFDGSKNNTIGGLLPAMQNVICGNAFQGVAMGDTNTSGNRVLGNYIGVSPNGTNAIANHWAGVDIFGSAHSNVVGGSAPGEGNLISGNGSQGVNLAGPGTTGNTVQGNYIGPDASGAVRLPNLAAGVDISGGASSNVIGGALPGQGNLISGNQLQGIVISDTNTVANWVAGNYIGLDFTGTSALSNVWAGIELYGGAQSNMIGGSVAGAGNVISGNGIQGVSINSPGTTGNLVAGNLIGLDRFGASPVPNQAAGVEIFSGAQGNLVGGGWAARNIISGNNNYGVSISSPGTMFNLIQGNIIGLNAASTAAVPNLFAGLAMFNAAVSNQIGGLALGAGNLIASNLSDGIQLFDVTTSNNTMRANAIFGNNGNSIGLYNNSNKSAAAPSLTNAVLTTGTTLSGILNGGPVATYHLDFYANPPFTFNPQARIYLGAMDTVTGGGTPFSVNLPGVVPVGQIITATATDLAGNTSDLSAGIAVTATDSVQDGIPNAWRQAHFGGSGTTTNSQSCALCDPDGDGSSNWQEFLAGTNPTNSASALRLGAVAPNGVDINVSFPSVSGVVYRIEARNDVVADGWFVVADQVLGNGALLQITDPNAAALPRRFYRAEVVQ